MGNQLWTKSGGILDDARSSHSIRNNTGFAFDIDQIVKIRNHPIEDDYTIIQPHIGQGSFGKVYQIYQKSTKILRSAKKIKIVDRQDFIIEFQALKHLDHPNILKLYEVFIQRNSIYLITDFYEGGSLKHKIKNCKKLSEFQAAKYMEQILLAISSIHEAGYIHCDLKPENILLQSTHKLVKIIDFGMCRKKGNYQCSPNTIGTRNYHSPEVKKGVVLPESDIWVCGGILLQMVTGRDPSCFKVNACGVWEIDSDLACLLSKEVVDLVNKLTNPNPSLRLSAKEALEHDWFKIQKQKRQINMGSISRSLCYISEYPKFNRLQSFFIAFITRHILSLPDKLEATSAFMEFDRDNNGFITICELKDIIQAVIPEAEKCACIQKCLKQLIMDKPQKINLNEFLACSIDPHVILQQKYIMQVFNSIYPNEQEEISTDALKSFVDDVSPENQIEDDLFERLDLKSNGRISFNQFSEGLRQNLV